MQSRPEPEALRKIQYSASPLEEDSGSITSSGRRTTFIQPKVAVFEDIKEIFHGKLIEIKPSDLRFRTWENHKRTVHQPSRILPYVTPEPQQLLEGRGTIKSVRMTVHNGPQKELQGDQAAFVRSNLRDTTLYNFWGIPEGRQQGSQKTVVHYGMGYVKPKHFEALNKHLEEMALKANSAAHFH